jgi:lipopolysaccharide biosynthesis glycosyltransferase
MLYLFGLDRAFVMPAGVAIRSLDRFLDADDEIMVFHIGLDADDLHRLSTCAQNATFRERECSDLVDTAWVIPSHLSAAAYLRNLAPHVLPDTAMCVYLDADVVVRRDLAPLSALDLSASTLAAVRSRVAAFAASIGGVRRWFELGIPSTSPCFNSGVLVMNLDRWRERDVTAKVDHFLREHGREAWIADQEALNAALWDDWLELDRSWNYVTHVGDTFLQQPELEPADPHIAHFAGRRKPWVDGPWPLFAEDWYDVLGSTPWAGWRPAPPPVQRGVKAGARRALGRLARRARSYLAAERPPH